MHGETKSRVISMSILRESQSNTVFVGLTTIKFITTKSLSNTVLVFCWLFFNDFQQLFEDIFEIIRKGTTCERHFHP